MRNINEAYTLRNKALSSIKGQLTRRGRNIRSVPRKDMRSLTADFYMDEELCKFKCTQNSQVNIIFEVQNNGNIGWFLKTKAKYFIYSIIEDKVTYIIDIQRARDYINNPLHKVPKTCKGSFGLKDSMSYMISIDTLKDHNIVKEIINRR